MSDRAKRKIEGSRQEAWRELNGLVVCDKRSLNNYDVCISPQSPLKADCVEAPHPEKVCPYNGILLNRHPSTMDTHDITNNSKSPNCPSVHLNS